MNRERSNNEHDLYNIKLPFPFKLHDMLSDARLHDIEHIVSWQPHGKAFRVHKPQQYVDNVMQKYFNQSHYKSFQRQLHIYGFRRILKGLDKGAYYHSMFVKGNEMLSLRMTRCKIKGPSAQHLEVKDDPDFYCSAEESRLESSRLMTMSDQELSCPISPAWDMDPIISSLFPLPTTSSTWESEDKSLFKALSLPTRLSENKKPQGQILPHVLRRNVSFSGGKLNRIILQEDFQPRHPSLLLSKQLTPTTSSRRGSLMLSEGDDAFFAGKKFHFVEEYSPLLL